LFAAEWVLILSFSATSANHLFQL